MHVLYDKIRKLLDENSMLDICKIYVTNNYTSILFSCYSCINIINNHTMILDVQLNILRLLKKNWNHVMHQKWFE